MLKRDTFQNVSISFWHNNIIDAKLKDYRNLVRRYEGDVYIRTYILHYMYVLSRIGKTGRETAAALCSISNRTKIYLTVP